MRFPCHQFSINIDGRLLFYVYFTCITLHFMSCTPFKILLLNQTTECIHSARTYSTWAFDYGWILMISLIVVWRGCVCLFVYECVCVCNEWASPLWNSSKPFRICTSPFMMLIGHWLLAVLQKKHFKASKQQEGVRMSSSSSKPVRADDFINTLTVKPH